MSALGTLIESSKCSILNSGVLKTPRAKDPHVQICVCGGGVKSQGSGKGHPRGVRDQSSGGGREPEPEGKGGVMREGRGGGCPRGVGSLSFRIWEPLKSRGPSHRYCAGEDVAASSPNHPFASGLLWGQQPPDLGPGATGSADDHGLGVQPAVCRFELAIQRAHLRVQGAQELNRREVGKCPTDLPAGPQVPAASCFLGPPLEQGTLVFQWLARRVCGGGGREEEGPVPPRVHGQHVVGRHAKLSGHQHPRCNLGEAAWTGFFLPAVW